MQCDFHEIFKDMSKPSDDFIDKPAGQIHVIDLAKSKYYVNIKKGQSGERRPYLELMELSFHKS